MLDKEDDIGAADLLGKRKLGLKALMTQSFLYTVKRLYSFFHKQTNGNFAERIMIFRSSSGVLVEVNRYSFVNDRLYYEKLVSLQVPLEEEEQQQLDSFFTKSTSLPKNKKK